MQSADYVHISMASAQDVRNAIVATEQTHLRLKKQFETDQLDFYLSVINCLTNEDFFNPILTSISNEIIGRFCSRLRVGIHATFVTPGDFSDLPGYFQIKFTSTGFHNCTPAYDKHYCEKLTESVSPYVQGVVRRAMEKKGWKVWWTPTHFCFQDANEYQLIQDALFIGSLYRDIQPLEIKEDKVQSSCLTRLDLSKLTVDDN
jgi:hypothetical protein